VKFGYYKRLKILL